MIQIVEWTDVDNVDDAQEIKELNTCYLKVGDEVVRVYLNHETYKAYAYGSPHASAEALKFLVDLGYEPIIKQGLTNGSNI